MLGEAYSLSCVQCEGAIDHDGNDLGLGDMDCFNGVNLEKYSKECPTGEYCGVEFWIDWLPRGYQSFKVRRSCRTTQAPADCMSGSLTGMAYKDCISSCTGDNCNTDNDQVFKMASTLDSAGNPKELKCFSCSSDYDQEADIDGMPNCYATPQNQPNGKQCPVYANAACFKSKTLTENDADEWAEHYYKGCSTFPLTEDTVEDEAECLNLEQTDLNGVTHRVLMCETMCEGNNEQACNGGTPKGNGKMCYSCEASINHLGHLQGWGDASCVDHPHNGMLTFCDEDEDSCATEFTAEWKLLGQQVYTMKRGCGKQSELEEGCLSMFADNYKHKTCRQTCTDINAVGCNGDTSIFKVTFELIRQS